MLWHYMQISKETICMKQSLFSDRKKERNNKYGKMSSAEIFIQYAKCKNYQMYPIHFK